MERHNIFSKIIAVILTIIMIVGILPITVFAEEFNETQIMKNVQLESDKKEKSPIIGEAVDKRDENTKVFEREDGSFTAVVTSDPIHYEDNGEWKEIDNTLVRTSDRITNKENSFSVSFPTVLNPENDVLISDGESTVSFAVNNIENSGAVIDNSAESGAPELISSINTASSVEYKNIAAATDLKYELNSDSLKESIILNSKPTSVQEYTYTVSASGTMRLNSDGSIYVYENSNVKFVIDAPYMFDSEENLCEDISVSLAEGSNGTYTLKYTPNTEWLASDDRAYPVTIDPTVRVYQQRLFVTNQVGTCSASGTERERYYYLQKDSENSTELYIRLTDSFLASLGSDYIITGAEVSLSCAALGDDDTISVHEISKPWDAETTSTVSKLPTVLDFNVIHANEPMKRYVWDITDLANKWSMGFKTNYGVAFTPYNDTSCNTKIFNETSLNYSTYRPWFEIDYAQPNRFTDDDVESFDMGRAGTLYLNKYSGRYYVERSDLSLNGNIMPIEAGEIYNPWGSGVDTGLYTGAYWINSHFMKMFSAGIVKYNNAERNAFSLVDAGGERTYFYEIVSSDSEYGIIPENFTSSFAEDYVYYKSVVGDSDKCLWVRKDDTAHTNYAEMKIETSDSIYSLDSAQRVCAISSKSGEGTANITFKGPKSSTISAITDGMGRKYKWNGTNDANGKPLADKLTVTSADNSLISVNTKNGAVNVGVDYDYTLTDSGVRQLTKIIYPDGEEVSYEYNSDNLLTKMVNVDGSYLSLTYSKGRIRSVGKYTSAGDKLNSIRIKYDSVHQRSIAYNGLDYDSPYVILQQYDRNMEKTSSVDNKGNFSYTEYDSNGDVVSYSTNGENTENLIVNGDFSSAEGWEQTPANRNTISDVLDSFAHPPFDNLGEGTCYVRGKINTNVRVYRTLPTLAANAEGEVYTLSGWARNDAYTSTGTYIHGYAHENRTFAIAILDGDGTVIAKSDFSPYVRANWQFTAVSFKLNEPVENAKAAILMDNQVHFAIIDDLRLVKSTASYCAEAEEEEITTNSYDEQSETVTVGGTTYRLDMCGCSCAQCTQVHTVTVDSVETEVYYNCACDKENTTCDCFGCRQERSRGTTKNANGDLLTDTITNGGKVLTNVSNAYTENRNYLASSSDSAGNTVYYNYNANTGFLDSYSLTNAQSNLMQYTYNAVGALEKVTQAVSGLSSGSAMSAEYTYSGDRITSMSHSGSVYTFEYNPYGNVTDIKVAGSTDSANRQSIVSYGYDAKQRNNRITYGNGTVISYTYNDDGNIGEISYSTGQKYAYTYNEDKALTAAYDYSSMIASIYEDGRVSSMKLFTVSDGQPVLGETIYACSVNDDGDETVTTFDRVYTMHSSTKEYVPSTDSVKTKGSISWNGWTVVNSESESDFYGRTTSKQFTVNFSEEERPTFGTEYTYADTATVATNKISRVKNTLDGTVKSDYTYTYDDRGNILTVSKSGTLFREYVYDEASQVTAEYNYAEHTAMTYVYDANGNIVSKTPYTNVTSSDLSAATQGTAIAYGYTDANWSDKLTSYNGQAISYDASGNPTSYKGDTVTWNGRLMTSYTNSERHFEYAYNSDGMRTLKKVYEDGALVYTEIYVWDGDVLLANKIIFTDGKDPVTARYLYDESGELYGMDYNGMGIFAYLKNLQGDIVSIISLGEDDSTEVQMEYDAWGKPIFKQGSNAFGLVLIALVNSVSYRGYFYDYDTGLYYLRSRYYDPETGRFINADDTDYLGYDDTPLSMNLFAYCENNPVFNLDKTGNSSENIVQITVNFYDIYTYHPHCDIAYDGSTISYGSDNGIKSAKFIDKINGTQGYILYKEANRSYDADDFRTIKVKVYYDKFVDFFVREINKTHYKGLRKRDDATYPSIVYEPQFSRVKWRSSKYYKYKLDKVTCVTFAADWLYYCMDLRSKNKLKNNGKDMQKFTLPIQLYNYLKPLR